MYHTHTQQEARDYSNGCLICLNIQNKALLKLLTFYREAYNHVLKQSVFYTSSLDNKERNRAEEEYERTINGK